MAYLDINTGTHIHELNTGSGIAIWGFRACAHGAETCCVIRRGYENALGVHATSTLNHLSLFAQILGSTGRRKIYLSPPNSAKISPDELSIIATFSAAQIHEEESLEAHLLWLFGSPPTVNAMNTATDIGNAFADSGFTLEIPQQNISRRTLLSQSKFIVHKGGRA